MNNEKNGVNGVNMETEQARQLFTVAVEQAVERTVKQAVTEAVEEAVNPRFDEQDLKMEEQSRKMEEQSCKMEEQNHRMDKLRADMRVAISESNTARLKGTIAIAGLITGFGSAIAIGVSSIMVSLLK
ncbi:hypothetical protein [Thioalkalivibrio sp. HK1]|uniref:hypothetical protein n=1 Tax=Thioalkalivibrio sp. HK1 TaxID=1469245 RepID=UPI0004701153|nr:hypothetical protein [Thioalkalivibrio sp. HK1]